MPRRREVPKREVLPDPKFGSVEITKFVNMIMLDGKKAVAERIVYGALEEIQTKSGKDPLGEYHVLAEVVKEVNKKEVLPEEVLSDSLYLYSGKDDSFCRVVDLSKA